MVSASDFTATNVSKSYLKLVHSGARGESNRYTPWIEVATPLYADTTVAGTFLFAHAVPLVHGGW